jgi:hypothetical protein
MRFVKIKSQAQAESASAIALRPRGIFRTSPKNLPEREWSRAIFAAIIAFLGLVGTTRLGVMTASGEDRWASSKGAPDIDQARGSAGPSLDQGRPPPGRRRT